LVEYELYYGPLKVVKGQGVTNFIVDHEIQTDHANLVAVRPWKVFFDGSICTKGCGIGYVVVSPRGITQEMAERLDFRCTNNQSKYKALIAGLKHAIGMGVRDVEAFGDSQLVVQQERGESQCLDGTLNKYRDICARLVSMLDTFHIGHVHRGYNEWPMSYSNKLLVMR
jgi:hypothetical protein